MQFKKTTLSWLIFIIPALSLAQSSNLPQGAKESWLLNRMDIKLMNDTNLGFSTTKPYLRKTMVAGIERYYMRAAIATVDSPRDATDRLTSLFTATDAYNMQDALLNSSEWVSGETNSFQSKSSLFI